MKKMKEILGKLRLKAIGKLFYLLVILVLALVAGATAASALKIPRGVRLYSVQSGSMAPAIPAGSIVVIKEVADYQKGEVITFKSEIDRLVKNPRRTITHRINEVKRGEDGTWYVTKGDFNPAPDVVPVKKDLVLGKVIFSIPLIGFPVSFSKTLPGLVILIIVPATIIVYRELLNIKKEVLAMLERRKKKKSVKKN